MKKFDYDPMHQYVEKERTRSMLIEAGNGPSAGTIWGRVFLLLFLGMIGGVYYFATQTPRGRDLIAAVTKDPLASQRAARRAAKQAAAQAAEQGDDRPQSQAMASGAGSGGGDQDDTQEMENLQKSQEAMGHQLEAFAEGKAPPPSPEAVRAAMTGQAPQPVRPAPAAAPPGPATVAATAPPTPATPVAAPAQRDPASVNASVTAPATGSPPYLLVSRIPSAYLQERQEFPDLK